MGQSFPPPPILHISAAEHLSSLSLCIKLGSRTVHCAVYKLHLSKIPLHNVFCYTEHYDVRVCVLLQYPGAKVRIFITEQATRMCWSASAALRAREFCALSKLFCCKLFQSVKIFGGIVLRQAEAAISCYLTDREYLILAEFCNVHFLLLNAIFSMERFALCSYMIRRGR